MAYMKQDHPCILQSVGNVGQQDTDPPVFVLSSEVCKNFICIWKFRAETYVSSFSGSVFCIHSAIQAD